MNKSHMLNIIQEGSIDKVTCALKDVSGSDFNPRLVVNPIISELVHGNSFEDLKTVSFKALDDADLYLQTIDGAKDYNLYCYAYDFMNELLVFINDYIMVEVNAHA